MTTQIHRRTRAMLAATAAATLAAASLVGLGTAAGATPNVCPHTDGWVKVDLTEDGILSSTVVAPEGMLIAATCVKASTDVVVEDLGEGVPVVELVTPATNRKGEPQAISHYAVLLVPADGGGGPVDN